MPMASEIDIYVNKVVHHTLIYAIFKQTSGKILGIFFKWEDINKIL